MREGQVIDGRFRLDHLIRPGIVAAFYAGRDLDRGQAIAAWVLDGAPHLADGLAERAGSLQALHSPHLAHLIAATLAPDGVPVLIEDPIEGESLVERLARAPLSLGQALTALDVLLQGLGDCHRRGIVHRDVRPENVFLVRSGGQLCVQLRGAGYAALFSDQAAPAIGGVAYGNPLFTAPEQWVNRAVDPSTDLYAVAGLAYVMLSGSHFIEPGAPLEVCRQHFTAERPLLHHTLAGELIPAPLAEVLVRAASPDRGRRFGSADAFRAALTQASAASLHGRQTPPPAPSLGIDISDISLNVDVSVLEEITIDAGISQTMVEEYTAEMFIVSERSLLDPPESGRAIDASEMAEIEAMPDDTLNESLMFVDDESVFE